MGQNHQVDSESRALYSADLALLDDCDDFFASMGDVSRARQEFNSPVTRPAAAGLYEVLAHIRNIRTGTRFYAHWNGLRWGVAMSSKERALGKKHVPALVQCKAWREVTQ